MNQYVSNKLFFCIPMVFVMPGLFFSVLNIILIELIKNQAIILMIDVCFLSIFVFRFLFKEKNNKNNWNKAFKIYFGDKNFIQKILFFILLIMFSYIGVFGINLFYDYPEFIKEMFYIFFIILLIQLSYFIILYLIYSYKNKRS